MRFMLSDRQKVEMEGLQSEHTKVFLIAISMEGIGQRETHAICRAVFHFHLVMPLYVDTKMCSVWKKSYLDTFGYHAIQCRRYPVFKYFCDRVGMWVGELEYKRRKKFLSNSLQIQVKVDIQLDQQMFWFVFGPRAVCPIVGIGNGAFEMGLTVQSAAVAEIEKHEKACKANQHCIVPFSFDNFGFMAL